MYMLLPIYSICNLNTVSWGTREDPRPQEKNDLAAKRRKTHHMDFVEKGGEGEMDGDWSLGCGSACRLLCCLKPDKMESSPQVWRINEKLAEISRKLERIERKQQPGLTRRAELETIDPEEEHFWLDVIDKYLSPLTLDPKEQERVRAALIE
ncbi:unnamed protein product, partial [Strongylus vulgaris]